MQDYTNTVTETWRETGTNFWLICPKDDQKGYKCSQGLGPHTWHEPLIESISDILDHLRLMESDLRP